MNIIIYINDLYHLIPVTKEMLVGIPVEKGMDFFEVCKVLREHLVYEGVFMGCALS